MSTLGTASTGVIGAVILNTGENTDAEAVTRVTSWINQVVAEIQREAGIKGLQVEGYADFAEDDLNQPLAIASAHNARSSVTRINKAWLEEYEWDDDTSDWVTTGNLYPVTPISYEEYLELMVTSNDVGVPTRFALALPTDRGSDGVTFDINCYLYPPPDSDDTEGDGGKRWRFRFFGEASIGALSAYTDVVYPVGADDLIVLGCKAIQCDMDKDYTGEQINRGRFRQGLSKFMAVEHSHKTMYVFSRPSVEESSGPKFETVVTL